eukprot:2537856-Rhodomonas_salina.1
MASTSVVTPSGSVFTPTAEPARPPTERERETDRHRHDTRQSLSSHASHHNARTLLNEKEHPRA